MYENKPALHRVQGLFTVPELVAFSETGQLQIDPAHLIMQTFRHHYDAIQGMRHIIREATAEDDTRRNDRTRSMLLAAQAAYVSAGCWLNNIATLENAVLGTRLWVRASRPDEPGITEEGRHPRPIPEITAAVNRRGLRTFRGKTDRNFSLYGGWWDLTRYSITPLDQMGEPLVTLTTVDK